VSKALIERDTSLCPACGYGLPGPAWPDELASFEICPSCGMEFGFDDGRGASGEFDHLHTGDDRAFRVAVHALWRERWIREGCTWWLRSERPPDGWDAAAQLARLERARA
jgi:hypothetical protein